jgi:hypothetical protein
MPHGSDEVLFIGIILGIAIVILVALLAGVVVIYFYAHPRNDKLTFDSPASTITDFFPGTKSKEETAQSSDVTAVQIAPETASQEESESLLPTPVPETPIPSFKGDVESTLKLNEITTPPWVVPLMAVVMLGLILALYYLYNRTRESQFFEMRDWYAVMMIVAIGVVSGGALGVRIVQASWRQIVLASLGAGAGMMLLSRFEFSPFYTGSSNSSYPIFSMIAFLIIPCLFCIPAFLLPLFDPALRQKGPAPSTGKVMTTALIAGLLIGFAVELDAMTPSVHSQSNFGLPIFLPLLLLLIGLVAALAAPMSRWGAAIGGFGILLLVFIFASRFLFNWFLPL